MTESLAAHELKIELYRRELAGKLCRRVTKEDMADLPALLEEMSQLCRRLEGVGLAAPQVGVFIQFAIVMPRPGEIEALVNPKILNLGGRDLLEEEGCLSFSPFGRQGTGAEEQATARVWRSEIAHVQSGTLEDPEARELRIYKGCRARIAQHEIDHLQGVFFIDRCGPVGRNIVLRRYGKYLKGREQGTGFRGQ